jgi:hypothetical protein
MEPLGIVYGIGPDCRDTIKVGFTKNPVGWRLRQMQVENDSNLVLFFSCPGTRNTEYAINFYLRRRYPDLHLGGEWFTRTPQLMGSLRYLARRRRR